MTAAAAFASVAAFLTPERLPNWAVEFLDYDPATLPPIPDGWEDQSWRNDSCPNFASDDRGGVRWEVFTDYADPALREYEDTERFSVRLLTLEPSDQWGPLWGPVRDDPVMTGDDWSAVLAFTAPGATYTVRDAAGAIIGQAVPLDALADILTQTPGAAVTVETSEA